MPRGNLFHIPQPWNSAASLCHISNVTVPTHFAVVFDAAGKTFRHELYRCGLVRRLAQWPATCRTCPSTFCHCPTCQLSPALQHTLLAVRSDYKGQRPEMPDAIRTAIPRLHTILQAMAVPQIQVRSSLLANCCYITYNITFYVSYVI